MKTKKVILVTGASSGMGKDASLKLIKEGHIVYKHALEGWSDCLRLEVAQFGIDVVFIESGAILTEFGDVMTQPMLDHRKILYT